jgi:hypothetical protein
MMIKREKTRQGRFTNVNKAKKKKKEGYSNFFLTLTRLPG